MLKERIRIGISCLIVISGIILLGNKMSNIVEKKDSYSKNQLFYEQKKEFDVLFMGTSHVCNDVYDMQLWEDYGIVSYNLGGHGFRMETIYWTLMNALDYMTPNVVVIDCFGLSIDNRVIENENFEKLQHSSFDRIPLSKKKVDAIFDIMGDSDKKLDYLWKFYLYHGRWNEITSNSFEPSINISMGSEPRVGFEAPKEY